MIQSFSDRDTEELFYQEKNRRFSAISRVALRKLFQLNRASTLRDLAVPPGNRLEALRGALDGMHSIRVNDQWRIVFRWSDSGHRKLRFWITIDNTPITLHVTTMNPPITPGEILLEEYLKPMNISQNAMARAIGVPPRAVNEIVLGRRSITPAMSIRFGAFFEQSPDFWHGLQVECDFRAAAKQSKSLSKNVRPARLLATAN